MLIDTHCHLFYDQIKSDLQAVLKRANRMGVDRFICVATNLEDAVQCITLSEDNENIYSTIGIHPHDSENAPDDFIDKIYSLMRHEKVVAVGEMGLDYFKNISDIAFQKKIFKSQMEIANDLRKPVVFHNRNADQDTLSILSDFKNVRGVAHCFSSTLNTAKRFLDLGYYISFSGNLTFKNSHLPEVAKNLPLDRILVETDSPYLSPVPFRGKTNEPGRTRYVAEKLSEIHGISLEEIAEITSKNAEQLFNIKKT